MVIVRIFYFAVELQYVAHRVAGYLYLFLYTYTNNSFVTAQCCISINGKEFAPAHRRNTETRQIMHNI